MSYFTLDLDGLKKEMSEIVYTNLTDGDDDVGTWALESAKMLTETKFQLAGKTDDLDWTSQKVIKATLLYAVYYLYSNHENEEVARDKRLDGNQILSACIGYSAFDIPQDGGSAGSGGNLDAIAEKTPTVFKVVSGTDSWNGYGGLNGI